MLPHLKISKCSLVGWEKEESKNAHRYYTAAILSRSIKTQGSIRGAFSVWRTPISKAPLTFSIMKTIAVVFALCVVGALAGITEEQRTKLKAYKDSCIAETGVNPTAVENIKRGQLAQDDEKVACFATCMLKKIGILNPDASINEEVARAKLPATVPQGEAEAVFANCRNIGGANACEKGGNLLKCFMENKRFSVLQ
ncbi:hypothetical protein KM043_001152 [Ampulex compressa]|nr:hypothetical protein KM043_001152 [Ampulex compressa]